MEYSIVYRMLLLYPRYERYTEYILLPQAFSETLGLFVQEPAPGRLLTRCRYPRPLNTTVDTLLTLNISNTLKIHSVEKL